MTTSLDHSVSYLLFQPPPPLPVLLLLLLLLFVVVLFVFCCHFGLCFIIIIIMYICYALINAQSTHMIHINLNVIFYTHVEHSPTKTIYIK